MDIHNKNGAMGTNYQMLMVNVKIGPCGGNVGNKGSPLLEGDT